MNNILGKNPYTPKNFPIGILTNNTDLNKKLVVEKILTKLITNKTNIQILKGPQNSETRFEKYIGLCGVSPDTNTAAVTLCTSETTSLFTIEPTKKYKYPIDTLRGIVSGKDEFRIVKSKDNDHNSTGTYLGLAGYSGCQTPTCVMLDRDETLENEFEDYVTSSKSNVKKLDTTKFTLYVQKSIGSSDDDIDTTIYKVFTGQVNIKFQKGKNNFPSARGTFLGLCDNKLDQTPCKTPTLSLSDSDVKSQFRIHSMDLFNISCCSGENKDVVACGAFNPNFHMKCDSIIKDYCGTMKSKNVPICSCLFSNIKKPSCFDTKCKKYGYKTEQILNEAGDDCGVNQSICYELSKRKFNSDLDERLYLEACSNYKGSDYTSYVFERYWTPIIVIFVLCLLVVYLFKSDYYSKKK